MILNRLSIVACIQVIPLIAAAAELPRFDKPFWTMYAAGVQAMVTSGDELSPSSKRNNALDAYKAEHKRLGTQEDPRPVVPETRRSIFVNLWYNLCRDQQYQVARQALKDSPGTPEDRKTFMGVAATRAAEFLMPHGVKFDLTKSGNTPEGHRNFLRMNKDVSKEESEYMFAGSVVLYALGVEAKNIMDAKAEASKVLKSAAGEAKS